MANTKLQKQARKLNMSEAEKEYRAELGSLASTRDKDLEHINMSFHDSYKELMNTRAEDRKSVWDKFNSEKNRLIKHYAEKEAKIGA